MYIQWLGLTQYSSTKYAEFEMFNISLHFNLILDIIISFSFWNQKQQLLHQVSNSQTAVFAVLDMLGIQSTQHEAFHFRSRPLMEKNSTLKLKWGWRKLPRRIKAWTQKAILSVLQPCLLSKVKHSFLSSMSHFHEYLEIHRVLHLSYISPHISCHGSIIYWFSNCFILVEVAPEPGPGSV